MKRIITLAIMLIIASALMPSAPAYAGDEGFDVRTQYLCEVTYGNFNMNNGSVVRTFTVTFDKEFYFSLDEAEREQLLGYLSDYIRAIGFTPETDVNGRVIGTTKYDSVTDMYIDFGLSGYEKNDNEYRTEKGLLFNKVHFSQKTIFDGIEDNSLNLLLGMLYLFRLERADIALSYHYGTPYKIIGSDAERSYLDVNNKINIHEFYMDLDNSGRRIKLVQTVPNTLNWYLTAAAAAVFILLLFFIAAWGAKLRKKRRGYHAD